MLNSISIMGRLSSDPQLRRTASGKAVASFSVACERDFKNQQTGEKEVDFIECIAWGSTAEIVEKYFHKGQMAMVTGRLQIQRYTDKSGQKRSIAKIVVTSVYFCGGKESGAQANCEPETAYSAPSYQPTANAPENYAVIEDAGNELPF